MITLHVLHKVVSFRLGDRGLISRATRAGVVVFAGVVAAARIIKAKVDCRPNI